MDEDIALGMKLRGLGHPFHAADFRQHLDEEISFIQQFEGAACAAFGEHLGELIANALAAHRTIVWRDARGEMTDGVERGGFER